MSVVGTFLPSRNVRSTVDIGGTTDMTKFCQNDVHDPKQTSLPILWDTRMSRKSAPVSVALLGTDESMVHNTANNLDLC
jgi:hypothetical protein